MLDKNFTMVIFTPSRGIVDIKWYWHNLHAMKSWVPPMASYQFAVTDRRGILESFNLTAKAALEAEVKYLCILEDDVFAPPSAFEQLIRRLQEHPDHGIATGVYFMKREKGPPLVFKEWEGGAYWTWEAGDVLLDMAGGSQGLAVVDVSIFKDMEYPWFRWDWEYERPDGSTVMYPRSADLYLFYACQRQAKKKVLVDCGILGEHHCRVKNQFYPMDTEIRERYGYPMVGPFGKAGGEGKESNYQELSEIGVDGVCESCGEEMRGGECTRCGST